MGCEQGTFVECAAPGAVVLRLATALLELLAAPQVHKHPEPFVRRSALIAASQVHATTLPIEHHSKAPQIHSDHPSALDSSPGRLQTAVLSTEDLLKTQLPAAFAVLLEAVSEKPSGQGRPRPVLLANMHPQLALDNSSHTG